MASERELLRNEGKKRIRNAVRLEASVVADRLLKLDGGFEDAFEKEFDARPADKLLVGSEYDQWIKDEVRRRFAPVLTPAIDGTASDA
jgi:hypothetical protein